MTDTLAAGMGERLRLLEQCGFLLRKVETYDSRYRTQGDAYEWAVPTGGHGLRFSAPRILMSCRRVDGGERIAVELPAALAREGLVRRSEETKPTAVVPDSDEVAAAVGRVLKPVRQGRPAWQAERIEELLRLGGDRVSPWARVTGNGGDAAYQARLRELLAIPPRYWQGWGIQDDLLVWHVFHELLPEPAQDHVREYWRAWLMPDLVTKDFFHPQSKEAVDYWTRTRDWRGRSSFFRAGYNKSVSTQNFNHTAAMGALLGGALIDAENAMDEGRECLERLPLRYWGFQDGNTQEMLDHYYLSITLSAQKMFADFAPSPVDRLMGRILVDRTMELLTSVYHPRLRRCVASSGRARLSGVLVEQDGIYGALHTVSKAGVLNYTASPVSARIHGMPAWSHYDFPPGRVAIQTLPSPWAPDWTADLVDDKSLPWEETSTETTRGGYRPTLWRRTYLGRCYGLASADIRGGMVDLLGQWVRRDAPSTRLEDLGTLTARYVVNKADLASTRGGWTTQGGVLLTFQSRNRAIVFAKPHTNSERLASAAGKDGITTLATVIGLWNFAAQRDWQVLVDGAPIGAPTSTAPLRFKTGQAILIRDGVTYLAILPLQATDLGRDSEIEIGLSVAGRSEFDEADIAPALTISLFNLRRGQPVKPTDADWTKIRTATFGGFVIEMGDAAEHGSFDGFVRHMRDARLSCQWREDRHLVEVAYQSGGDTMEAGFATDFPQPAEDYYAVARGAQAYAIPYRRLNGKWPYLPDGLERDTPWSQQGTTGRLEKNGVALVTDPGRKAYLLADPLSGAVVAYNPLPDPQSWSLALRDGVSVRADGKVALLRLEFRPWAGEFDIDYAPKPEQVGGDMARSLIIGGLARKPAVRLNGQPATVSNAGSDFRLDLV